MHDFIYDYIKDWAYVGIGALMAIFPAEAIMPFVGYQASQGELHLPLAIAVGVFGSTLGSTLVYVIARQFNQQTTNKFIVKYGKPLGITQKKVLRAGRMFDAHARSTVFFGRFIPGVRSAVSIPAGYQRMRLATFVVYTALGSGVSAVALALLGFYAQVSLDRLQAVADASTYLIGATIVIVVVAIIVAHKRRTA